MGNEFYANQLLIFHAELGTSYLVSTKACRCCEEKIAPFWTLIIAKLNAILQMLQRKLEQSANFHLLPIPFSRQGTI